MVTVHLDFSCLFGEDEVHHNLASPTIEQTCQLLIYLAIMFYY